MNYSPNDLQNLVFKKSFTGYNEDKVNDVLDKVIEDYTAYIHENIELKDRVNVLSEAMQRYKNIEQSLQNSLVVAQQTADEIKKAANEKAANIIKEAEMKAQSIIAEANQEVLKLKYEYEEMKKKLQVFRVKTESLLNSQLELLKHMFDDVD